MYQGFSMLLLTLLTVTVIRIYCRLPVVHGYAHI